MISTVALGLLALVMAGAVRDRDWIGIAVGVSLGCLVGALLAVLRMKFPRRVAAIAAAEPESWAATVSDSHTRWLYILVADHQGVRLMGGGRVLTSIRYEDMVDVRLEQIFSSYLVRWAVVIYLGDDMGLPLVFPSPWVVRCPRERAEEAARQISSRWMASEKESQGVH